jgi:predicted TIM-barrel fold metal-dependent hydrolase
MSIRDDAFAGRPITVPIIDAHTHLLGYYLNGWYTAFQETATVITLMDHLGIDAIVTAPHTLVSGDAEATNEATIAAAAEYPGRIYGYIFVYPHDDLAIVRKIIARYAAHPSFVGFKLLPGYHGSLLAPAYAYALDFAAEHGCPVLTHLWGSSPGAAEVEAIVQTRPALKLLAAHQGGGSADCTDALVAVMREHPHVTMELCGSLYNHYALENLVEMVGDERIVYGSDLINLDPRYDFGQVVFSTLPDESKSKILAGNFLRLLEGSALGSIAIHGT